MRWPRPTRTARTARPDEPDAGRSATPLAAGRGGPRRDRHGRGLRGPLAVPAVPAMVTRSQRFDDCVLEAVERLGPRVGDRLDEVEFAVMAVPPVAGRSLDAVPLAETFTPGPDTGRAPRSGAARVVLYRRPLEARASTEDELAELVARVVVEQVAALLFLDPRELDDRYEPGED